MIKRKLPSLLEVNLENKGSRGGTCSQKVQTLSTYVKEIRAVKPGQLLMHLVDGLLLSPPLFLILL